MFEGEHGRQAVLDRKLCELFAELGEGGIGQTSINSAPPPAAGPLPRMLDSCDFPPNKADHDFTSRKLSSDRVTYFTSDISRSETDSAQFSAAITTSPKPIS